MVNEKKLASWVSAFLSPLIWLNFTVALILCQSYQRSFLQGWQAGLLVLLLIVVPMAFFLVSLRRGRFDLDLTHKKERFRFFIFYLSCGFLALNLVFYFSWPLFKIFLPLTITSLFFAVVTFWDKASLHVGVTTAIYLIFNLTSSWQLFWLFPLIPLVAWSRLVLGRHSLAQVLEGFLIPILTIPLGFFLLGVI